MFERLLSVVILALAGVFALGLLPSLAHAATTPPGFKDEWVTGVGAPTAIAFTPDERMLVATQYGQLYVYEDGIFRSTALNLGSSVCTNAERGLLGVAVDPDFDSNNYIYLYYTTNESGACKNRVSRFTMSGNTVTSGTETVLVDNIPSPAGNHNAGDVHFGKDDYLYVSVGDGGCDYAGNSGCGGANDAARDPHVLLGKILRITRDGDIPATNPYQDPDTTARCNVTGQTTAGNKCQETFASGLRNPFRMAFDPNAQDTRFLINDVGQGAWEEIDEGEAGADYGWNCREGAHTNSTAGECSPTPTGMTDPIHEYGRTVGASITGGAFVPNGVWPSDYDDSYLFGDFVSGKIFKLSPDGAGGYTRTDFVTGLGSGSAVAMTFGPHGDSQALYYTTYANGGEVRRISANDTSAHTLYGPATRDYYTGWDSSPYYGYGIAYRYGHFLLYGYLVPSHAGTYTEVKFLFAYNGLLYDSGKRTHAYNYEQGGYSLFYQPYAPPLNSPGWWVARATDADSGLYKDTWVYVY